MTETTKYAIARPINGISINGDEYLLDESLEVMTFDSKEDAETFLKDNGFTDSDLEQVSVVEYENK